MFTVWLSTSCSLFRACIFFYWFLWGNYSQASLMAKAHLKGEEQGFHFFPEIS